MTTFIGVDLAWQSDRNHTGVAAFRGDSRAVACLEVSTGISTLQGVLGFIERHESADTVVAVDAPLIIPNMTGQRPCERLVSSRFGRFHAGAHTSNRSLYPDPGGVRLAEELAVAGYRHCPEAEGDWPPAGRWFFEVYPHPAHVVLFERARIIKYKRGRVASRRAGLAEFREEIRTRLFGSESPFELDSELDTVLGAHLPSLRGRQLKEYEDVLDAILCSYLAYHLWRWGWSRNEMIGDLEAGYIVVPTTALPR